MSHSLSLRKVEKRTSAAVFSFDSSELVLPETAPFFCYHDSDIEERSKEDKDSKTQEKLGSLSKVSRQPSSHYDIVKQRNDHDTSETHNEPPGLTHKGNNHTTNGCNDEDVQRPGEDVGESNDALPPLSVPSTEEKQIVAGSTKSPSTTLTDALQHTVHVLGEVAEKINQNKIATSFIADLEELTATWETRYLLGSDGLVKTTKTLSDGILSRLVDRPEVPVTILEINSDVAADTDSVRVVGLFKKLSDTLLLKNGIGVHSNKIIAGGLGHSRAADTTIADDHDSFLVSFKTSLVDEGVERASALFIGLIVAGNDVDKALGVLGLDLLFRLDPVDEGEKSDGSDHNTVEDEGE
ncbi:hypothetical protein HG530_008443 [Fusarium avenaceum]|nr:hypothetical protein HG530_008443 [Fusarium avenaceum]